MPESQHSAVASALGYAYQSEIALLTFLERDDPTAAFSVEALDDFAIQGAGDERAQVKLHLAPGNITDGSPELWKTLRVWSARNAAQPDAVLTLLTTSTAQPGSIAALLRRDQGRDPVLAHKRLCAYARATDSKTLETARRAFLDMTDDDRVDMVDRIVIADRAPTLDELDASFARVLRHAAPANRRQSLISRLREWWLLRVEEHLSHLVADSVNTISPAEIEARITDIRDQLTSDNLPIDTEAYPAPTSDEVADDQRAFVMQLRLISLSNPRIGRAIHDHHRAFAQRSRWAREDLLQFGELARYEQRLVDEWERLWLPETDGEELSEADACARGRAVQQTLDAAEVSPIRQRVNAPYITRGSFHILADELKIGWHPDWVARMDELLTKAES